jgi:hypothetical protein
MNLLFTSVANFLTFEAEECLRDWRARYHVVEQMPFERVANYLRFDYARGLALVDAIVCMADTDRIVYDGARHLPTLDFPLEKALALAEDVRNLPETCTMRDGRKWRSIPFAIFSGLWDSSTWLLKRNQTHARIFTSSHSVIALNQIQDLVDQYQDRVLDDYRNLGILVRFVKGRAQIGPALRRKDRSVESEYYYAPGDRRSNKGWVTVKRDSQGLRQDVELFHMLLDKGASETEMHRFFEEHPAILMEARMGIPISHRPRFDSPENQTPDFSISPILGPLDEKLIELLELKGPRENTLTKGLHRGFTAKVKSAVDQVRDYGRYLHEPANIEAILRALGYIPDDSKKAVLIGRAPRNETDRETWAQRQSELDVQIVTYDEILETQASQIRRPYSIRFGTPRYPIQD